MRHGVRCSLLAFTLLCAGTFWASAQEVPKASHRVEDQANVMSQKLRNILAAKLQKIENDSPDKPQMVIMTVPTLGDASIEDFATDAFRKAGIGQKEKDNGLLILIAVQERKIRVEVGYGLEGQVPDSVAQEAINKMKPFLKKGKEDWFSGLSAGVDYLGAQLVNRDPMDKEPIKRPDFPLIWVLVLLGIVASGVVVFWVYVGRSAKRSLEYSRHYSGLTPKYSEWTRDSYVPIPVPIDTGSRYSSSESKSSDSGSSWASTVADAVSNVLDSGGGSSGGGGSSDDF